MPRQATNAVENEDEDAMSTSTRWTNFGGDALESMQEPSREHEHDEREQRHGRHCFCAFHANTSLDRVLFAAAAIYYSGP